MLWPRIEQSRKPLSKVHCRTELPKQSARCFPSLDILLSMVGPDRVKCREYLLLMCCSSPCFRHLRTHRTEENSAIGKLVSILPFSNYAPSPPLLRNSAGPLIYLRNTRGITTGQWNSGPWAYRKSRESAGLRVYVHTRSTYLSMQARTYARTQLRCII